jgi:hypothetical protein
MDQSREPEIQDLDISVSAQHDIFRLHVTMDNPGGMRDRQCLGDLSTDYRN